MENLINTTENLESAFLMPTKILVTVITFQNGLQSKMITGIPKGVNFEEIQMSLKDSLSTQKNIASSQSTLVMKDNDTLKEVIIYDTVKYSDSNRLKALCPEFNTSFGTA